MFNPVDAQGNVELPYDRLYAGFFKVAYASNASIMDDNLCEITGMADHFPPSPDGSIVYRSFETLEHYLASVNVNLLMNSDFSFKDPFKQLIWDLGQVAIKCKTKGLDLDMRMDRIFVDQNGPRIHAIACIAENDTNIWLNNLLALYNSMKTACHKHYPESARTDDDKFNNWLTLLKNSSNLRDVQSVFQSLFLWSTSKKFGVIDKLDDMIDCYTTYFVKVVQRDLPILLTWRNVMMSDQKMGVLYNNSLQSSLQNPSHIHKTVAIYHAKEVDLMLKFLRSNVCHFPKLVQGLGLFNDEFEVVEYYDNKFPEIMTVIYKGCKLMMTNKVYPFDI